MDEWYNQMIKDEADSIRQELEGGRLHGFPIDFDNEDMVLVAAYWFVTHKETIQRIEDLKLLG